MITFGLIMVYSASFISAQEKFGDGFAFIKKQAGFCLIGLVGMLAICRVEYVKWKAWAYPALIASFVLLALVMVPGLGASAGHAQRWIRLTGIRIQPSEFAKLGIIIFVARQLYLKQDRLHKFTAGVLSHFILPLPAFMLLLLQPDFGTTAMLALTILILIFLAGAPKKYFAMAAGAIALAGFWLAYSSPYRYARLMGFLDPWKDPGGKGFQVIQSMLGFHHGSAWGTGLGASKEKLLYLPEAHNDFIFAVIGEELGFIGVVGLILAYLIFIQRGLKIAMDCQRRYQDRFGMLLAAGITLALGLQGFVNMSVVLGLLPTKGLTLPFISYGGSALIANLLAVGVLLSIARGPRRGNNSPQKI